MAIELGSTAASLGSALGAGFAKPIESALDLLARKKLSDLGIEQERKQRKSQQDYFSEQLQPILGGKYSPELINYVAGQPPEIQNQLIGSPGALGYLQQMVSGQQNGPLQQLMQPQQYQQAPPQQQQPGSIYDQLMQLQGAPIQPGQGFGAMMPQQQIQQPEQAMQQQIQPNQLAGQQALQQALSKPITSYEQKKLTAMEQKESRQQYEKAYEMTKKTRDDILEKGKIAKQTLHSLDEMSDLNQSGKLDTPGYVEFLKNSGLDIPALMNPESQEFKKIAYDFMSGMKATFGGKVSNQEMEAFLNTIPSLSQSPEGRQRVISVLKYKAKADKAYTDTMIDIVKKNRGIPPLDLNEQIYSNIDKKLDALHGKFKKELTKPVPAGQNRLVTALQSVTGTILNRIPRAIMGAGAGAYTGSKLFPGLGTAAGAALGGLAGLGGYSVKDLI